MPYKCAGEAEGVDCGPLLAPSCPGLTVRPYLESSIEGQSSLPAHLLSFLSSHLPPALKMSFGSTHAESIKWDNGGSDESLRADI